MLSSHSQHQPFSQHHFMAALRALTTALAAVEERLSHLEAQSAARQQYLVELLEDLSIKIEARMMQPET